MESSAYELIHEYIESRRRAGMSRVTMNEDRYTLTVFTRFIIENYPDVKEISEITRAMVVAYEKHIAVKRDKKGNILSADRKTRYLSSVKLFFAWLEREEKIFSNPAARIVYPRVRQPVIKDVLTPEEMEQLLRSVSGTNFIDLRDRAILELLYSSGVRSDELCSIQVPDIDLDKQILFVRKGKFDKERLVPFGKSAAYWVSRYLELARPLVARDTTLELFVSFNYGKRMAGARLRQMISERAIKAGINKKVNTHTFRHSCASHMLKGRADIRYVQKQLGHRSILTTEKYLKIEITDLKEVHERCHPREQEDWKD